MKTFSDATGRPWVVSLNIGVLKRVRALCDVDLMAAVEGKLVERIVGDPVHLCDILYVVCQEEAVARNVSDEEFGRALAGDAIDAATTALLEELVDFFPKRRREVLRTALEKMTALQQKSADAALVYIRSPELDRQIDKALAEVLGSPLPEINAAALRAPDSGNSSTSSPVPSA